MSFVEDGWEPDFPLVMHFVDVKNVCRIPSRLLSDATLYPDYDAAKNHEDRDAALRLVKNVLSTPENIAQLKSLKNLYPGAIIVPVHGIEANGKNKIPGMLAEYIATKTGLKIDYNIVQANSPHRTGADGWHRFAFRSKFDGAVQKGREHILVDDVCTHGGTFADLRFYIEKNGGKVVHTSAIALGSHGDRLSLPKGVQLELKKLDKQDRHGLQSFCKEFNLYDGNYKCLTKAEGLCLAGSKGLDRARDFIIKARQEERSRMGEKSTQERETAIKPDRGYSL